MFRVLVIFSTECARLGLSMRMSVWFNKGPGNVSDAEILLL